MQYTLVFCSSVSFNEAPGVMDVTGSQFSEGVNISVTDMELEELTINKDATAQMKAAFIYYIKKNLVSFLNSICGHDTLGSQCHTLFPVSDPK
jgi:hypothetical protein